MARFWGPSWVVLALSSALVSLLLSSSFLKRFSRPLGAVLGAKLRAKNRQKHGRVVQKSGFRLFASEAVSGAFWERFGLHFRPPNRSKSLPRAPGGSREASRRVLGRLERVLEHLGRLLTCLGGVLGRLGRVWGASWGVLGRLGLKKPPSINLA